MNSSKILWAVGILIVIGVAYYFFQNQTSTLSTQQPAQTDTVADNQTTPTETDTNTASRNTQAPNPTTGSNSSSSTASVVGNVTTPTIKASTGINAATAVALSSSGFSPNSITIAKGDTVTWTNTGGSSMWVASAVHPSHTSYDGTSKSEHCAAGYSGVTPFDQCGSGTSYSFTFNETGTWNYHNHLNPSETGIVVVK